MPVLALLTFKNIHFENSVVINIKKVLFTSVIEITPLSYVSVTPAVLLYLDLLV